MNTPKILLRPAASEDVSFIFSSWLKSFRNSFFAKPIDNTVYFSEQHKLIEKLVKQAPVIMACNPDDISQIYGFICAQRIEGVFCLHYLYVKHSFRKLGIGRALVNSFEHDSSSAGVYTHHTACGEILKHKFNLVYHPYILSTGYLKEVDCEQ